MQPKPSKRRPHLGAMRGIWAALMVLFLLAPALAQGAAKPGGATAKPAKGAAKEGAERPAPTLQLVIVGPGDDEYTLFGHAAMLVITDPKAPITEATLFNFGITNFKRSGYVFDFLAGRVTFWGHHRPYKRYLRRWKRIDRTVHRYPLALPEPAARAMAAQMFHDVLPKNTHFVYDAFRENCATKIRDLIDIYTGGAVWQALGEEPGRRSFRDDVRRGYSNEPALLMMTETVAGPVSDKPRSLWALTYRPAALLEGLSRVTVGGRPLVGAPVLDYQRAGPSPFSTGPNRFSVFLGILTLLLALVGVLVGRVSPRVRGLVLGVLVGPSVLLGALLLWVSVNSEWPDMRGSWLVFWFTPLDLGLLWTAGRALIGGSMRVSAWTRGYIYIRIVIVGLMTAASPAVSALDGPFAPRLLGLVGLLVAARCTAVDQDLWRRIRQRLGRVA